MFRPIFTTCVLIALTGCVNTPTTKVLITPFAAVGVHSFAPKHNSPDQMPPNAEGVSRIAANYQHCANNECTTVQ